MASLGIISVDLKANFAKFTSGLDAAAQKVKTTSDKIVKSGDKIKAMGENLTNFGSKASVGVTAPLVAAGGAAVAFANKANAGFGQVETLIDGPVGRIGELKSAVHDMSAEFGRSTDDLSAGLYQLISVYGDTADSADILKNATKAAAAGQATISDSINLTAAVTQAYGDTSKEAVAKVNDLAFAAVKMGKTTFPELAMSVPQVTAGFKDLGVSQEEIFGAFAALTPVMANTAETATALKATTTELIKPNEKMAAIIESLGFKTGKALIAQHGFHGALKEIRTAAERQGMALGEVVGSVEAYNAISLATGAVTDAMTKKTGDMTVAIGAADEAFGKSTQGVDKWGFITQKSTQKLSISMQKLGDLLLPVVIPAFDALATAVLDVTNWFAGLDPTVQAVVGVVAGLAAAVGPLAAGLGAVLTILPSLAAGIGIVSTAFSAMLANPATAWIVGISAAIAAGIYVWNNWGDEIKAMAGIVWDFISTFTPAGILIKKIADQIGSDSSPLWRTWRTIVDTFNHAISETIGWLKDAARWIGLLDDSVDASVRKVDYHRQGMIDWADDGAKSSKALYAQISSDLRAGTIDHEEARRRMTEVDEAYATDSVATFAEATGKIALAVPQIPEAVEDAMVASAAFVKVEADDMVATIAAATGSMESSFKKFLRSIGVAVKSEDPYAGIRDGLKPGSDQDDYEMPTGFDLLDERIAKSTELIQSEFAEATRVAAEEALKLGQITQNEFDAILESAGVTAEETKFSWTAAFDEIGINSGLVRDAITGNFGSAIEGIKERLLDFLTDSIWDTVTGFLGKVFGGGGDGGWLDASLGSLTSKVSSAVSSIASSVGGALGIGGGSAAGAGAAAGTTAAAGAGSAAAGTAAAGTAGGGTAASGGAIAAAAAPVAAAAVFTAAALGAVELLGGDVSTLWQGSSANDKRMAAEIQQGRAYQGSADQAARKRAAIEAQAERDRKYGTGRTGPAAAIDDDKRAAMGLSSSDSPAAKAARVSRDVHELAATVAAAPAIGAMRAPATHEDVEKLAAIAAGGHSTTIIHNHGPVGVTDLGRQIADDVKRQRGGRG